MNKKLTAREHFVLVAVLILAGTLIRIWPDRPFNFAPVGALALFGAAAFSDRRIGLLLPLGVMFLADLFLGLYPSIWAVYISFLLIGLMGRRLYQNHKPLVIGGYAIGGSMIFFLLSNFGVWTEGLLYPMNFMGLMQCYAAGIPFFWNTLASDLLFSALLFGAYGLATRAQFMAKG